MNTSTAPTGRQRGSAIVIVLAVLLLILAFMAGNTITLGCLHREVQLIEKRQLRKYESAPAPSIPIGPARPVGADARPSASPRPDAPPQ